MFKPDKLNFNIEAYFAHISTVIYNVSAPEEYKKVLSELKEMEDAFLKQGDGIGVEKEQLLLGVTKLEETTKGGFENAIKELGKFVDGNDKDPRISTNDIKIQYLQACLCYVNTAKKYVNAWIKVTQTEGEDCRSKGRIRWLRLGWT